MGRGGEEGGWIKLEVGNDEDSIVVRVILIPLKHMPAFISAVPRELYGRRIFTAWASAAVPRELYGRRTHTVWAIAAVPRELYGRILFGSAAPAVSRSSGSTQMRSFGVLLLGGSIMSHTPAAVCTHRSSGEQNTRVTGGSPRLLQWS